MILVVDIGKNIQNTYTWILTPSIKEKHNLWEKCQTTLCVVCICILNQINVAIISAAVAPTVNLRIVYIDNLVFFVRRKVDNSFDLSSSSLRLV